MRTNHVKVLVSVITIFSILSLYSISEGAATFPTKAINMLIYTAPGGSTDLTIRMLCKRASELFGQPVIAENNTAGGGFLALAEVYKAAPDGHTIGVAASSMICVEPLLRKAPYDPNKMTPILSYGVYPFTLAVKVDAPWKTVKEFVEYVRKNPGKVNLSTSRPYSMENFAMFMLQNQEKLDFKLVPYEGGAPAVAAALGGHTDGFIGVSEAIPFIREGKMRGLATFLSERMPGLPDIPTLKESGYNVAVESRLSIYGPPEMPKDLVKRIEDTFKKSMESEDFKKIAKNFEVTPSFLDSKGIGKYHRDLTDAIRSILIKMGKIKE
jgi:tripartite-type tricarboxylate transporter receptor subunit TctC